jgi:hypothetical protein
MIKQKKFDYEFWLSQMLLNFDDYFANEVNCTILLRDGIWSNSVLIKTCFDMNLEIENEFQRFVVGFNQAKHCANLYFDDFSNLSFNAIGFETP